MNGIALLSLLAAVTAPPWQIELDRTADNAVWQIHIDKPLLDQWATAGKNRVAHTTRIELPALPAVETFLIRFGDKPLGSDWIPLTVAAGALTLHPQVDPNSCQTEIRLHPALTRRLKLGGYELRGRLPTGQSPHRQLVIQIATAHRDAPSGAVPPAAPRDIAPTPPLKAVTRTPAAFAEPEQGTVKDWPPRPAASTDIASIVVELPSSATRAPEVTPEAQNTAGDLERAGRGPAAREDLAEEIRSNHGVQQAFLSDIPLSDTPEPDTEPAIVAPAATEAAARRRPATDTEKVGAVRPATFLAEPAPVDTAPPTSAPANSPLETPEPAGTVPLDTGDRTTPNSDVPSQTAPTQTNADRNENNPQPAPVDRVPSKPPAQWLLLLLGLFASAGLNVFLVINHRTIAGQYRQLVTRSYEWEPRRAKRAGLASGGDPSGDASAEADSAETRQPAREVDRHQENESDTQTADDVADQEERSVVHRRKKRNQRHQ